MNMIHYLRSLVVLREKNDNYVAIVRARVDRDRIASSADLISAIVQATTEWVRESDFGQEFYCRCNGHIALADLADEVGHPDLQPILSRVGVVPNTLSIDLYREADQKWDYDDNLYQGEEP